MSSERYLTLTDGRIIAYAETGGPTSSIVVVFLHGVFGIGAGSFMPRDVHYLVPTVPGWGESSPRDTSKSFTASFLSNMSEFISAVHSNHENMKLYVAGGSYGTALAQILYGATFEIFPLGKHIVGCIILAPFSLFRHHKEYSKSMNWKNHIAVGVRSPFNIISRLTAGIISTKIKSVESARSVIREVMFKNITPEEQAAFDKWSKENGISQDEFELEMTENAVKTSDSGRPHDDLGKDMARWLNEQYKNSQIRWVNGGHITSVYALNGIWADFRAQVEGSGS
ncbi:hypothetical protein C8J56DRAFT_1013999 [Mycena floridula]|nr:hypothetical protein C8J56DRAFT_1013999 [Mycena floridula]